MRGKSEVQTEPRVSRLTRWPSSLGRLWPRVGLRGPRIAVRLPAPPVTARKPVLEERFLSEGPSHRAVLF